MGGLGCLVVAFDTLDALTVLVASIGEFAHARGLAQGLLALLGDLNVSVDHPGQRHVTRGHAVQLGTAIGDVHFAIRGALGGNSRNGLQGVLLALCDGHALALGVFQVSILAEASGDASKGATRRMWSVAGGRASAAAFAVHFQFTALLLRGQHHERLNVGLRGAGLLGHAFSIFTIPHVSVLASASGHADTRAQRVRILASAIASAALAEFLVLGLAHARLHRNHGGLSRGGVALFFGHAHALFISQMSFQTEATNDAVLRAQVGLYGASAVRGAGRTAREEFLLLRTSRELGLELNGELRLSLSITLSNGHAFLLVVPQIAVLAVASAEAS